MLLANKRVAEFVHQLSKKGDENTMVYRIHEGPDRDRLQLFADFASRLGYKLKLDDEHLSGSMNKFMATIEGKPEASMLSQLAIRTMSKARYSTEDIGHFGLGFRRYSHFTSPIRRYPDMMAHRLLQHYLSKGKPEAREPLEEQCKHASARDTEKTFEGVISGVTEFGIFVEITENNCEGLVRMQDLNDDFYEYDKDNFRIVGQRSKKMYTFGDPVVVRVKETNLARRSMDYILVSDKAGRVTDAGNKNASRSGRDRRSEQVSAGRKSSGGRDGAAAKGENRRGGRGRR
jgi:ribonuclease R